MDEHADQIDKESCVAGNQLIERIAAEGAFRVGVPEESWEVEGNDMIEVLQNWLTIPDRLLYLSWDKGPFIDNVLKSANPTLETTTWRGSCQGICRGYSLSNAVKFCLDLEWS